MRVRLGCESSHFCDHEGCVTCFFFFAIFVAAAVVVGVIVVIVLQWSVQTGTFLWRWCYGG